MNFSPVQRPKLSPSDSLHPAVYALPPDMTTTMHTHALHAACMARHNMTGEAISRLPDVLANKHTSQWTVNGYGVDRKSLCYYSDCVVPQALLIIVDFCFFLYAHLKVAACYSIHIVRS